MFSQQLKSELVPALGEDEQPASLNDSDHMRRLLERHTGFTQFRLELPDRVTFSPGASRIRGEATTAVSLQHAVLAYVAEDQPRLIGVITEAIRQQKGFHFTGRRVVGGQERVIETIADVIIEDEQVRALVGFSRDVSDVLEKEALAISRARPIRRMVEDMPVPIVVLDRGLKVVACSTAWARSHGVATRDEALGKPINKLIHLSGEITAAIIGAMQGRTQQLDLLYYSATDGLPVPRHVVVTPWQCGSDAKGGVLMMSGEESPPYATLDVADRAFGRRTRSLLEMADSLPA